MEIQPHQQRVIDERDQLAEKINKLTEFIGSERFLSLGGEQDLLRMQLGAMLQYLSLLERRIELWWGVN